MAVDEFGREIPPASAGEEGEGGGRRSPSPPHQLQQQSLGVGSNEPGPSLLFEALSSSRYGGEPSSSSRGNKDDHHHHQHHRGDRDRDNRDRGHNDDRHGSRKRKNRSESPPPRRGGGGGPRGGGRSTTSSKPSKPHPSTVYAEDPMLCQYLWKEANEGKTDEDYEEYRKSYCLNYVRTFFNNHMDDSWFRSLYSPLERYRVAVQERKRATQEAKEFAEELESSLSKQLASSSGGGSTNSSDPSFFVLKARLGGGIRQSGKSDYHHHHHSSPHKASQQSLVNPIPGTHVLALTNQVLPIQEVPYYVTDEQLTTALMQHVSSKTSKATNPASIVLFSGPPVADLSRTAYLYAPEEVRKEIIQQLNHLDRGGATASSGDGAAHVPRKEDTYVPKTLELVVECSDAYGRTEVDADGKGGEPDDRAAVPPRKATVWVSTQSLAPHVQVLSAALSSKHRIQKDQESALKLARAYDNRRAIPAEYRLETILVKAVPNIASVLNGDAASSDPPPSEQDIEDALDVTIAYLRRVHLLSFYNSCSTALRVGEVLNGNHPASTIHLRLANADEILEPNKEGEAPVVDLLVTRLENSIQKSLDEAESWEVDASTDIVLDKEIDAQAKEIEHEESQVESGWIEDHALVDEDGRARCAFHFCRKLFKDSKFLHKHLIKKHSEFLRAEIAKCHDGYMMKAWDSQQQRPVPPILVDCGHRFGLKPTPVLGAADPLAADPEPELWRREEERREIAEREAEARRERYNNSHHRHNHDSVPSLDAPLSEERGHGGSGGGQPREKRSNFVDVDDMKVEKVEMAFDNVEIPVQPPKKKKKKKLL